MEKIKAAWDYVSSFFRYLAKPLEWTAGVIAKYPKGAMIVWAITIAAALAV